MERDAIDLALHEVQQVVEVSIRAAERLQGVEDDNGFWFLKCRLQTTPC
jgi:hypothetical protein